MTQPRVGIVGARRARQGLGPFVARELQAAGADVVAFACTSEDSVARAGDELRALGVANARGHVGLAALLAREELDALAILSPVEAHAGALAAALAAGLHVLCEKPFVWREVDPARVARELVAGFGARGLLLRENCQWPYALPAFEALHPGTTAGPPRSFAMRLSPASVGLAMLVDALPHPLSLLQALTRDQPARIVEPRFSTHDSRADALHVSFVYECAGNRTSAEIELVGRSAPPREVWLSLDGRRAHRIVRPPDYSLTFADSERQVVLPDPLTLLVGDFVRALEGRLAGAPAPRADTIAWRMDGLCSVVQAFEAGAG
jgi:predicted dehydrogenase